MEQTINFTASNIIATVIMIAIFTVVAVSIRNSAKNKTDSGMNFVGYFVHQELFVLSVIVLLLMTGEAALVASFHPPSLDEHLPEVARFIGHWGINLAGYVATLNVPKKLAELIFILPNPFKRDAATLAKRRKDKDRPKKIILLVFYTAMSLFISLFLPIVNIYILATGVGQVQQLEFVWSQIFTSIDMSAVYARTPVTYLQSTHITDGREFLGVDYSPFRDFKYPLLFVSVMASVHYALALLKGVAASILYYGNFAIMDKPNPVKSTRSTTSSSASADDSFADDNEPIREILRFYGYRGTALSDKTAECIDKKDQIRNATHQAAIGDKIAALYDKVSELLTEKSEMSTTEYQREERKLRADIKSTFRQPHTNGAGLGITLSAQVGRDASDD